MTTAELSTINICGYDICFTINSDQMQQALQLSYLLINTDKKFIIFQVHFKYLLVKRLKSDKHFLFHQTFFFHHKVQISSKHRTCKKKTFSILVKYNLQRLYGNFKGNPLKSNSSVLYDCTSTFSCFFFFFVMYDMRILNISI